MLTKTQPLKAARDAGVQAASVGFDWESVLDALLKVPEEAEELRVAIETSEGVFDELGDLLFAVVNVSRKLNIDPEQALDAATKKFERRFSGVVALLREQGLTPQESDLEQMELLWTEVKSRE